jgi:predicted small lipoprotein YifL
MRAIKMMAIGVFATGLLSLMGCDRQGPLERFGEEVDEAAEDVRNGGETLENKIDDAADDVREGVEDAREELER